MPSLASAWRAVARPCWTLASALLALGAGQPSAALPPGKALTQLRHDSWQTKDGLPQNSGDALAQGADGYLWIGTQEGLARFDGVRFTVYDRKSVPELLHNRVLALCVDRVGAVFAGTEGGGLTVLTGGRFRTLTVKDGLPSDIVSAVAPAAGGGAWVGTTLGLARVGADGKAVPVAALAGEDVHALLPAGGALWIGVRRRGLVRLEGEKLTATFGIADGLPSTSVVALAPSKGGGIWIGTSAGVARLSGGKIVPVAAPALSIRALLEDRDGALWAGTDGNGLFRIVRGAVERMGAREGLPDETVGALLEDREGNVWAGTQDGGLQRFADGAFTPYTRAQGLTSDLIWALTGDGAGGLWIGTKDGGVDHLEASGHATALGAAQGLSPDLGVQALWQDGDGTLWIGTRHGGLSRWRAGRLTTYGPREGLSTPGVSAILRDRAGVLWIGSRGGGLHRLAEGGRLERVPLPGASGTSAVHALLQDRAGDLWVGTNGGGLARIGGGTTTLFTEKDGLPIDIVNTLLEDARGVLWVGTYGGGLARFRDGVFATVSTKQGLFDDAVFGLLEDARGDFWISCNKGVSRVSRAALDAAADGRPGRLAVTVYGVEDGMKSRECNGANQPPAFRAPDGKLWFPTVRGAVAVDPKALPRNAVAPPVVVEEILIDGAAVPPRGALEFPPGSENLEIRYTAPSFTEPSRVRFRVKLEGYDRDWVDAGARRVAFYTHLPPAAYRFRVQARNDAGVWNEEGASLAFRFEPAFWQTSWFWLLATSLAAGLVIVAVRSRLRRAAAREAELVALVAERTRQLEDANRDLRLLSSTDSLTGIANRRAFDDYLRLFWTQARRSGAAISVLMIDCDDFKAYNDAWGHLAGDACLKRVAEALVASVSRTGDIVARFGGEEFAVLLLETPLAGCEMVAERMRAAVAELNLKSPSSPQGRMTISIGAATAYPGADFGTDALLARADEFLYRAKSAGKNHVVLADAPLGSPPGEA